MGASLPSALQWENFATVIEKGKLVTALATACYAVGATLIGAPPWRLWPPTCLGNVAHAPNRPLFLLIAGIAMPTNFVTLMKVMQWCSRTSSTRN